MSTISVTNITTANGTTSLVFSTGNVSAASIALSSNGALLANNSGGLAGQALLSNTSGVYWGYPVTGSNTQIQFNDSGIANSSAAFIFNKSTNTLTVSGPTSTGNTTITGILATGNTTVTGFMNVSSNATIGSNTLTLGSSSIVANNGWSFLPNGLLFQWGSIAANSTTGNVTLPVPFPNECFNATATRRANGANGFCFIAGVNTTVIQVRSANNTSSQCFWSAIGR